MMRVMMRETLRGMSLLTPWVMIATVVLGCGGRNPAPNYRLDDIRLVESVTGQQWFRAAQSCAQGPYELEVPASGGRWGEEFRFALHTPRKISLHAVMLVDDREVEAADAVFDAGGRVNAKPDNARCIADARERLVLGRTGGGGGTGTPGTPGTPGTRLPPPQQLPTTTAQLDLDTTVTTSSITVITFRIQDRPPGTPPPRIRIRLWSVEPNDLEGVLFGWIHLESHPNVSEAEYEAHLRWKVEERERERVRAEEEQRRADEDWRRKHPPRPAKPGTVVVVDVEAERARDAEREAARRRREAAAAERALRRKEFCAAHPGDRDCWGAGGLEVHLDLERHRRERADYCAAHAEDARCWTDAEWSRRRGVWRERAQAALAPPPPPSGPPPSPLAEQVPPRLSVHADWRPGYWQWTLGTWVWLAGMWRVPDEDIASEQTTTAPAAPPPVQAEVAPVAPVRTAVWIAGFWQWTGTSWMWIGGSWQLRPEPRVNWRAPEWRARGNVHVLIPGGWVRIGGGR